MVRLHERLVAATRGEQRRAKLCRCRVLDAMMKEKYLVKERQRKRKKRSRSVRDARKSSYT